LYCDIKDRALSRRLGQHLYESIAATGEAVWIHRTWQIYAFTILSFTQPELGQPQSAIETWRAAGLDAWDSVDDPQALIRELRQ
jgi:hypothetical protein